MPSRRRAKDPWQHQVEAQRSPHQHRAEAWWSGEWSGDHQAWSAADLSASWHDAGQWSQGGTWWPRAHGDAGRAQAGHRPARRTVAAQRPRAVNDSFTAAVYFGTFDPIHENHVAVAKFAVDRGHAQRVYFVVNGDNPLKPGAADWAVRQRLVEGRLRAEKDDRLSCRDLSPAEREKMSWMGREKICKRLAADLGRELELPASRVAVVQILGQDAFEHAVERGAAAQGTRRPSGIFVGARPLLVFPRLGSGAGSTVEVPSALSGRVTVVTDYRDPTQVSSTAVRAAAAGRGTLEGTVHPELRGQVCDLYRHAPQGPAAELGPAAERLFLLLTGGPGSGKTTLGGELGALGFHHVSGGDVYRAARAGPAGTTPRHPEGLAQTKARVFAAIEGAVATLGALVSFDGFLLSDLAVFEEKIGPASLVVALQCSRETMLERLASRPPREAGEEPDHEARVAQYLSARQESIRAQVLKSVGGSRRELIQLDAGRPLGEVRSELLAVVQAQLACRGLQAQPPREGALGEAFWEGVLGELESDPRRSYNLRPNAPTMQARGGSRALKNFNNLVKAVLIDWGLRRAAKPAQQGAGGGGDPHVEVLDVASGRGGDQMKFLQSAQRLSLQLCYTGVDIAEDQVAEARLRLRTAVSSTQSRGGWPQRGGKAGRSGRGGRGGGKAGRAREGGGEGAGWFRRARLFVGDVIGKALPGELPWQQLVSVQFALHYAFGSKDSAAAFLGNALSRLCSGGLLLITTVSHERLRELALRALEEGGARGGGARVAEGALYRVTFADSESAERARRGGPEFGVRYHFELHGEGIDCDEFAVPRPLLEELLGDLSVEILREVPFHEVCGHGLSCTAAGLSGRLLGALPDGGGALSDYSVYDRLGLRMSQDEAEVARLYTAYVCARREDETGRPDVAQASSQAAACLQDGRGGAGDVLGGGPPCVL